MEEVYSACFFHTFYFQFIFYFSNWEGKLVIVLDLPQLLSQVLREGGRFLSTPHPSTSPQGCGHQLTWDAGSKFLWKLRDEVVVDPIFHGPQHDYGPCVAHWRHTHISNRHTHTHTHTHISMHTHTAKMLCFSFIFIFKQTE